MGDVSVPRRLAIMAVGAYVLVLWTVDPSERGKPRLHGAHLVAVQRQADALYRTIAGTAVQRDADNYLRDVALNRDADECMARRGFKTGWHFTPREIGYEPHATEFTRYLVPPGLRIVSSRARSQAADTREAEGGRRLPPPFGTRAFGHAANVCHRLHPPSHGADGGEETPGYFIPRDADRSQREFKKMLDRADREVGDADDYRDCMADHGQSLPVALPDDIPDDEIEGYKRVRAYLGDLVPHANHVPSPNSGASTARWDRFLDREAEVLRADRACRQDSYEQGMALLAAPLTEFAARHRASLRRIEDGWQNILARATAAGFDTSPYTR